MSKTRLGVGIVREIEENTSFGRDSVHSTPAEIRAYQALVADWRAGATTVVVHLDDEARAALIAKLQLMRLYYGDSTEIDSDLVGKYRAVVMQARAAIVALQAAS